MTELRGHFNGKEVILDEPVPANIAADSPVKVTFEGDARSVLAELAELAVESDDLPADYSEQHDHYVKGTPRK